MPRFGPDDAQNRAIMSLLPLGPVQEKASEISAPQPPRGLNFGPGHLKWKCPFYPKYEHWAGRSDRSALFP